MDPASKSSRSPYRSQSGGILQEIFQLAFSISILLLLEHPLLFFHIVHGLFLICMAGKKEVEGIKDAVSDEEKGKKAGKKEVKTPDGVYRLKARREAIHSQVNI